MVKKKQYKWLFVVSISKLVGRGHINRSVSLASEIAKKIHVDFYSNDKGSYPVEIIKQNKNINFYTSGLNKVKLEKYAGVVIDIKKNDNILIRKLSKIRNSAIISDYNKKIFNIKTIISPMLSKRSLLNKNQFALVGEKYYLIPKKYKKTKKIINNEVKNILINFGYLDSKHYTLRVLEALNSTNYKKKVIVLIGENSSLAKKIHNQNYNFKLEVYKGITDLRLFYKKVDLCFGAAGVGMLERFLYGIPSITIKSSNDQHYTLVNAVKKKATLVLEYDSKNKFNLRFEKNIEMLLKNIKYRKMLSKNAYQFTDTKGSYRVAKYLLSEF